MSAEVATLALPTPTPQSTSLEECSTSRNLDVEMSSELISMDSPEHTTCEPLTEHQENMIPFFSSPNPRQQPLPGPNYGPTTPTNPSVLPAASPWQNAGVPQGLSREDKYTVNTTASPERGSDVPLSTIQPGPVFPSDNQMLVARTYGIRNEDGTYTRLIRVDEIDDIDRASLSLRSEPENMIVLPPLLQWVRGGDEIMIPAAVSYVHLAESSQLSYHYRLLQVFH